MNILIAYDGSNAATAALEDLTRAGLPQQAEAIVLTVADIWLPPAGVKTAELQIPVKSLAIERATKKGLEAQAAAKQIADRGAVILRERFPSWSIESRAVADSPAWGTIKLASDWPADLIVVGSQGHSAINRVMFGSVSQKIAIEAPCSVRVGRKARGNGTPLRILIGTDGSVGADAAITAVGQRSWPEGTEIRLMTAIDISIATAAAMPSGPGAMWLADGDEDAYGWVARMIDDASARLRAGGRSVSSRLFEGDPKQALLAEAESWGADSIFVGARGNSLIERLLMGSVSSAVAARATCSVEIVRPQSQVTK